MVSKKVVLHFPSHLVDQPIIYRMTREHDLVFNILKAHINPDEEGILALELSGDQKNYDAGIIHLAELGVEVQPLERDITRDEDTCTSCSACVVHCPPRALHIKDRKTMVVEFDKSKCILCEACILVCPVRATSVEF